MYNVAAYKQVLLFPSSNQFVLIFGAPAGRIQAEDIERIAQRMLQSKPSVAALGTLKNLPSYADISKALNSETGRLPKRYSLFRWGHIVNTLWDGSCILFVVH